MSFTGGISRILVPVPKAVLAEVATAMALCATGAAGGCGVDQPHLVSGGFDKKGSRFEGKSFLLAGVFQRGGSGATVTVERARKEHGALWRGGVDGAHSGPAWERGGGVLPALHIERIVCIGSKGTVPPSLRIPCEQLGYLSAEEVSQVLRKSLFGASAYPAYEIGKSGIFAAYAAHGVIPVSFERDGEGVTDVQEGMHYLSGFMRSHDPIDLEKLIACVHNWYQSHSVEATVQYYASFLA